MNAWDMNDINRMIDRKLAPIQDQLEAIEKKLDNCKTTSNEDDFEPIHDVYWALKEAINNPWAYFSCFGQGCHWEAKLHFDEAFKNDHNEMYEFPNTELTAKTWQRLR